MRKANASYTLTLARWHKVAERLTKAYSELAVSLKEAYCNTDLKEQELQVTSEREDGYGRHWATNLRIRLMRDEFEARLKQQLAQAQAEGYQMSDQIAERNKATLTLELYREVARMAGIV